MNIPLLPRGYSVPEGRILTPARCFDAQSRTEVLLCSRLMSAADSQNRFMQQLLNLSEREGFEPSVTRKGYNGFRVRLLRPLGHLSNSISFRKGGDSNPRTRYQVNSLAGSPIRPLSHLSKSSGERGIRTPGEFPHSSFQDCHHRPLGHLSNKSALSI